MAKRFTITEKWEKRNSFDLEPYFLVGESKDYILINPDIIKVTVTPKEFMSIIKQKMKENDECFAK